MTLFRIILLILLSSFATNAMSATSYITSNPAAVNSTDGSDAIERYLTKKLGIGNTHGVYIGGTWIANINQLFSGGIPNANRTTTNNALLANLSIDTNQFMGWKGGIFDVEALQLNAQSTNTQAGSVQGYNSIPGPPPLNRTELYQLWYRQVLFDEKFIVRVGKTVPVDDFNNVIKAVKLNNANQSIPAVSGLLYTPLFVNPTILGIIPGYYNSAYGITLNLLPSQKWYLSYGIYDGNLARGEQTGLHGTPTFNGAHFQIAEVGRAWLMGNKKLPGNMGAGLWYQHGTVQGITRSENNAAGYYLFGSQRLWYSNPGIDDSGLSGFYQFGANNSQVLDVKQYVGAGLTEYGLIRKRPNDSCGVGAAFSWLNKNNFNHQSELMLQVYYQAQIITDIYLEPALTYIPAPGANNSANSVWAGTLQAIILF